MDLVGINMPWIDSAFFEQMLEASDLDAGTRGLVQAYAVDGYVIIDPEIANFDALADEITDACSRQSLLLDSGPASEDVTE